MKIKPSEAEWAEIVAVYQESGQSMSGFCQERSLSTSALYRRLRKSRSSSSEFIELPRALVKSTHYEIWINGATLKLPTTERASRIAELMRALSC